MAALDTPDENLISEYLAPYHGKTLRAYYAVMFEWLAWCIGARIHVCQARQLHIEQWMRALRARGLSERTVSTKLVPVRGFYRWCAQQGHMATDITTYIRPARSPRRSNLKWLTREQLAQLLDAADEFGPPMCGIVHLLALNGLRLGETLSARVDDIGESDGLTTLHLPSRKGGVMDTVSLPERTVQALARSIGTRTAGRIFKPAGRIMQPSHVYTSLDSLSTTCELGFKLRPHMLRATFVTLSLDAGVPARDVMASTGHAHMAMIDYYDRAHASIRRNASHRLADYLHEA